MQLARAENYKICQAMLVLYFLIISLVDFLFEIYTKEHKFLHQIIHLFPSLENIASLIKWMVKKKKILELVRIKLLNLLALSWVYSKSGRHDRIKSTGDN